MKRDPFPTFRRIGHAITAPWRDWPGVRSRLASKWATFRARVPFLLRRLVSAVLVLFVVGGIPWTYFNIKYSREVARELTRLREAGEPITIADIRPKPVPDDQNAAILYQEVFDVSFERGQSQPEPDPALGVIPPEEGRRLAESMKPGEKFDVELAREVLSRPEVIDVLTKLEEASELPHAVWPIRWEDGWAARFPHCYPYRRAVRLMAMRARLSAVDDDTDDALRWVGASLRVSGHIMTDPIMITQFAANASRRIALEAAQCALDEEMPSPAAMRRLQQTVADLDLSEAFRNATMGERGMALTVFDWAETSTMSELASVLVGGEKLPSLATLVYHGPVGGPLRQWDKAAYLRIWRERMTHVDQPYRLQDPESYVRARTQLGKSNLAVVTQILLPGTTGQAQRDHAIASLDELCIVLDLKMHKREHGSYPATLDELATEPPEDPFSGEAYRYERRGEGFILWSIGQDLEDDGGIPPKPRSDLDWGEADIVWQCAR